MVKWNKLVKKLSLGGGGGILLSNQMVSYDNKGLIENIENAQVYIKAEHRHFKKGEFFLMSKSINKKVIEKKYTGETFRVLFLLLDMIDYNNRIKSFTQKKLGEELGVTQSNISKALKTLRNDKIIFKDGRDYYFADNFVKYSGDK